MNGGSSSSSLLPLERSFGMISMGDEVAKDKGGGGRFIDVGLFILPELDMVAGSETGRG